MVSYSLEKVITLDDDDVIYVKKDAVYIQILYYERFHPEYLEQVNKLTEFVFEFMNSTHFCSRIEMRVKDIKKIFTNLNDLPIDSFVKYFL